MTPDQIFLIAQLLLKYGPPLAQAVAELFGKKDVTADDWKPIFALAATPYDQYVKGAPPA